MKYLILAVIILCIHYGQAYKALVVEYYPTQKDTAEITIKENLERYRREVDAVKSQTANNDVKIVVFPEYGLTTKDVDPEDYAIEIQNNTYNIITELGDIAREYELYLVVNLLEKLREVNKATKYYNSNLVFNKQGEIKAKYRKINLQQEPKLTSGTDQVTFTTDFGVTFGLFTSSDILYYTPSRSILEDDNVTDIIYPTAWTSAVPFYTSLSIQSGYATANGVNLLAAAYAKPKEGLGGSGIYSADGKSLEVYIDATASTQRLIQEVPTISRRQKPTTCSSRVSYGLPLPGSNPDITAYKTEKVFDSSDYNFKDLDLTNPKVSTNLCHKDFCCNFNITINQPANNSEHYKLMVYDGQIAYKGIEFRGRICSLVACESDSKSSCGARINGTTTFTKIEVDAFFDDDDSFYAPVTLQFNLKPIDDPIYCDSSTNNRSHVQISTTRSQKGVLAFGILGRTNAASSTVSSGFLFMIVLAVIKFIV